MTNMGYVRFQNTVGDLRDCYNHIDDDNLSPDEEKARKQLIGLAVLIVQACPGAGDTCLACGQER
jgi:hypothetical protein